MTYWKRGESKIISPISLFDEVQVTNRQNLIEIKSQSNVLSKLRNITSTSGTAGISISDSEHQLSTGVSASSIATLDSAERGRYQPGYGAQIGIAYRGPSSNVWTGTASSRFGYFSDDEGFGFGEDVNGMFLFIRRKGVETKVYQSNWNIDALDGSSDSNNPSGLSISRDRGNIFQIDYAWYGYGNVAFKVQLPNGSSQNSNAQLIVPVHVITPSGGTSVIQPNLPIRAEVTNGDQATDYDVYIAGRQYSILGIYKPNRRLTSHTRVAQSLTADNGFEHVMSFRRKSTNGYAGISAKFAFIQSLCEQNAIGRLKTGATIADASWGTPTGRTGNAEETALEVTNAGTISGGIILTEFLIEGGGRNNASSSSSFFGNDYNFDLIEDQPLTLEIDTLVNGSLTALALALREDW